MPYDLKPGDTIRASHDIINDGSFPEAAENELLVAAGTRGVVITEGHLEENESRQVYLVQFELPDNAAELGPPIGCWPEDLYSEDDAHKH